MRVFERFFLAVLFVCRVIPTFAQDNGEFSKHNNFYISFGAGSSILRQFPSDIYFSGSNNLQLGLMYERAFHRRFSVYTGMEFEQVNFNFDGDLQFGEEGGITLTQAGPEKKYTGLRQRNIAIPFQLRFYFLDNIHADARNMFLQGGMRLVQSLDFVGSKDLETSYYYRLDGENASISLTDYTNQMGLQLELMVGFKGQFFERFDLLNSSTLGFMYQLNPLFESSPSPVYPVHFTWRFLF